MRKDIRTLKRLIKEIKKELENYSTPISQLSQKEAIIKSNNLNLWLSKLDYSLWETLMLCSFVLDEINNKQPDKRV